MHSTEAGDHQHDQLVLLRVAEASGEEAGRGKVTRAFHVDKIRGFNDHSPRILAG
jgi:hypothetical protein